ncbi:MAG: hypothetical protein ACLUO4_05790 [Christensenellales bacterium]
MEPVEPEVAKDVITKAQTAKIDKQEVAGAMASYKVPPISMLSKASGSDVKKAHFPGGYQGGSQTAGADIQQLWRIGQGGERAQRPCDYAI